MQYCTFTEVFECPSYLNILYLFYVLHDKPFNLLNIIHHHRVVWQGSDRLSTIFWMTASEKQDVDQGLRAPARLITIRLSADWSNAVKRSGH